MREFTETTFRRVPATPSYAGQSLEVVALRARPRDAQGRGAGEWRIWETFAVTRSSQGSAYAGSPLFGRLTSAPTTMTPEQVAQVAQAFAARVPDHEFELVRASLVIDEAAPV